MERNNNVQTQTEFGNRSGRKMPGELTGELKPRSGPEKDAKVNEIKKDFLLDPFRDSGDHLNYTSF
jgi:hypothetical protein